MAQRRHSHQRDLILQAVRSLSNHPTASEIYAYVHETDAKVSLGTVYRNLHLLAEEGEIMEIETPHGFHYGRRLEDHCHVVCTECGRLADVTPTYDHEADARAAKDSGFANVVHHAMFEGLCPECQKGGEKAAE